MRRELSDPRGDWARIIESQGLAYHRTSHPEHLTRPYWDESVHYVFGMEEVLALEAVVEVGDGQVSDLPVGSEPADLYLSFPIR